MQCQQCRLFLRDAEAHHFAGVGFHSTYCVSCCPGEVLGDVCGKDHPPDWLPRTLFGKPVIVEGQRDA